MKNQDSILIFGSSGQIGKSLIRKFTKNNYRVIAVTRSIHRKGYQIKTQSNYGYLELEEIDTFNENNIGRLMDKSSICINLIGILFEKKKNHFNLIHSDLPSLLSKVAFNKSLDQFIHISALGIESAVDSTYAMSKLNGEIEIRNNFHNHVILKPSIVFSRDDNFTTLLMGMLKVLPLFPLYYEGKTNFYPIHVSDMCEIIEKIILEEKNNVTIECIGPEKISFKEIIQKILKSLNIKRLLIPMPLTLAKILASFFEISMKKPLLTKDQLVLLSKENIPSGKYKTNIDLNLNSDLKNFNNEILKYSYMWKTGGEFSRDLEN